MPHSEAIRTSEDETLDALLSPPTCEPGPPGATGAHDLVSALLPLWEATEDEPDYWRRALATTLSLAETGSGFLATYDLRHREPRARAQRGCGKRATDTRSTLDAGTRLPVLLARALDERIPVVSLRTPPSQVAQMAQMFNVRPVALLLVHPLIVGDVVVGALVLGLGACGESPTTRQVDIVRAVGIAVAGAARRWTEQLMRLDRMKSDVVAALSHELRTPLTAIRGFTEVLADGEAGSLTDEQREYLAVIDSAARRLQRQVDDLVMLTRLQSGPATFEPRTLGISGALERAVERIRERSAARAIAVTLDMPPSLPLVRIDPRALDRALEHLLDNAVKFTPEGETIAIRCVCGADEVVVSVTNTGVAIAECDSERIFAAFYRTASALRDAVQGAGLGLTIVKSLVEQHGGRIWLEGTADTRTTFTFTLPVALAGGADLGALEGGE